MLHDLLPMACLQVLVCGDDTIVYASAQDSDLKARMKDSDVDGLAAQNAYLKEALETCRTQISGLTQQVQHSPSALISGAVVLHLCCSSETSVSQVGSETCFAGEVSPLYH